MGYGNDTRPYILLRYMGYDIVEYNGNHITLYQYTESYGKNIEKYRREKNI